jgi:AraC-like DNA-binding protein
VLRGRHLDDLLLRAGRHLLAHTLQDTARAFRLSPSYLSRAMRAHLPRLDHELAQRVEDRLAELLQDRAHTAAAVRWAREREPWAARIRLEIDACITAARDGKPAEAGRRAARIKALLDSRPDPPDA